MRCGCPRCEEVESYMVHSERDNCCVCPQCLYRCYACQGDGPALSREELMRLKAESQDDQSAFLVQHAAQDAADIVADPDIIRQE